MMFKYACAAVGMLALANPVNARPSPTALSRTPSETSGLAHVLHTGSVVDKHISFGEICYKISYDEENKLSHIVYFAHVYYNLILEKGTGRKKVTVDKKTYEDARLNDSISLAQQGPALIPYAQAFLQHMLKTSAVDTDFDEAAWKKFLKEADELDLTNLEEAVEKVLPSVRLGQECTD